MAVRATREVVFDASPAILDALADIEEVPSWSTVHRHTVIRPASRRPPAPIPEFLITRVKKIVLYTAIDRLRCRVTRNHG